MADELKKAARLVRDAEARLETLRARRDALIVQELENGQSTRDIAARVGMAQPRLIQIHNRHRGRPAYGPKSSEVETERAKRREQSARLRAERAASREQAIQMRRDEIAASDQEWAAARDAC